MTSMTAPSLFQMEGHEKTKVLGQFLYTLYLFTASDFKTVVIPNTVFGIVGSLSRPLFSNNASLGLLNTLSRVHIAGLWIWLNLLPFNINNQSQWNGIKEDFINKPWRPMPSRRLSIVQAKRLMILCYLIAFLASLFSGGLKQCISLIILGYWYNYFGGADENCAVRNLINAGGYLSFMTGTIDVFSRNYDTLSETGYRWLFLLGTVIFSTVHMQDLPDREGDGIRGRNTVPLVFGDRNSRWSIAFGSIFWSFIAPAFWHLKPQGYVVPLILGMVIAKRVLGCCAIEEDKTTFKLWNLWIVSLYLLPLVASVSEGCGH